MPFHLKKYTKLFVYTYIYKKSSKINANLDKKKRSKVLKKACFESGFLQYNVPNTNTTRVPFEGDFGGRQLLRLFPICVSSVEVVHSSI